MSVQIIGRLFVAAGLLALVAGCQEGAQPFAGGQQPEAAAGQSGEEAQDSALTLVERDVEAPEVFSLSEAGLWDGRPSLGGVWVAHSSVKDPERVIIRNSKNGKSVIGALFRREAENPGPSLQISSDAAAALEILAGAPAELSVTALRREEPEAPVAADEDLSTTKTETAAAEATAAETGGAAEGAADPIAAAAAALDEAEGKVTDGAAGTVDAAAGAAEASAEAVAAAAPEQPTRRGLGWLFGRKRAAEPDADAGAPLSATAETGTDAAEGATIPSGTIASGPIETAALPATGASATALSRAYVQIGIFSNEANASRAVDQMKAAGMTATVKKDASQGKTYWRVIVGPAASVAERDALAGRVKGLGYPDAYPVKS